MKTWTGSYMHFETTTLCGDIVHFTASPEEGEAIKEVLSKVRSIQTPTIKSLTHGSKGRYTRYEIVQYLYGGGDGDCGGGYAEVLHVVDAPEGRCAFVIHEYRYTSSGYTSHTFSEWETLEDAQSARNAYCNTKKKCSEQKGFIRFVDCGELTPWFYATGDEMIVEDFAVHAGFEAHPVYRLGRKFLVEEKDGIISCVTCMGSSKHTYLRELGMHRSDEKNVFHWVIMFSNGTHVHLNEKDEILGDFLKGEKSKIIKRLPEGEIWQIDIMQQFQMILFGQKLGGSIKFRDGSTLTLRYQPKGKKPPSAPGNYLIHATLKDGSMRKGWFEFDPSEGFETVVAAVLQKSQGKYVKVEVVKKKEDLSRKWLGVWHKELTSP